MEQSTGKTAKIRRLADWHVARLYSGEVSAKEEAEFFAWVNSSNEHRVEYERSLQYWDRASELADEEQLIAMRLAARSRKGRGRRRYWMSAAAAAAIVLGVFILAANLPRHEVVVESPQRYATAVGESRAVTLPDGSTMEMNTATQVIVDFTPESRRLILDYGEIYIDVRKDPTRPLSVVAGDQVVTAVGTEFSVSRVGDALEVAVAEGIVAVTRQGGMQTVLPHTAAQSGSQNAEVGDAVILRGGAIAEFDGGQLAAIAQNNLAKVEVAQGWLDGVEIFEDVPLIRVIGELNRYSPIKVLIEDSSITEFPVTTVLEVDNLEADNVELFLMSLESIHPVRVIRHTDRYVIVGRSD